MADWNHRDCTAEHCYWIMPKEVCQEQRELAEVEGRDRKLLRLPEASITLTAMLKEIKRGL